MQSNQTKTQQTHRPIPQTHWTKSPKRGQTTQQLLYTTNVRSCAHISVISNKLIRGTIQELQISNKF